MDKLHSKEFEVDRYQTLHGNQIAQKAEKNYFQCAQAAILTADNCFSKFSSTLVAVQLPELNQLIIVRCPVFLCFLKSLLYIPDGKIDVKKPFSKLFKTVQGVLEIEAMC